MLRDDLFTFTAIIAEKNTVKTNITLNPAHSIFAGHFPGQPVLPGVCLIQIVKEALEAHLHRPVRLAKGNNIKFLSMIVPGKDKLMQLQLKLDILDKQISVVADLSDNTVLFKFKGIFQEI